MKSIFKSTALAGIHISFLLALIFVVFADSAVSAQNWSVWGNYGTNPTTQFLGTTDNQPLAFRVNNKLAGRIDHLKWNVFLGYEAGKTNYDATSTGTENTGIGHNTLFSVTSGFHNCAIGSKALYLNTTGSGNTAMGTSSLYKNTSGGNNTAVGKYALFANTTGNMNTASGYNALTSNTTGAGNTGMGTKALYYNTTGNYNTAVGYLAYPLATGLNNYTGIGYAVGTAASAANTVEIGNTSVTSIKGQVMMGTYSDGRIKDNVKADVPGLAFITRLRPVSYNLNIHKQNELMYGKEKPDTAQWEGKYDIEQMRMTGFIAQEVEQAARETNYDFSGVEKPKNENGLYALRYSEFVVPLVKAVQEQQQQIDEQRTQLAEKDFQIDNLEARLARLEALMLTQPVAPAAPSAPVSATRQATNQNIQACFPNPASSNLRVVINPTRAGESAVIELFDARGEAVKTVAVAQGVSAQDLFVGDLPVGIYTVTLTVDGRLAGSTTVVVARQ